MIHIKTRRLILRDFDKDDFGSVHEYATDPLVLRYVTFGPNTPAQTKKFLKKHLLEQRKRPRKIYDLAIVLKKENKLIGSGRISIKNIKNSRGDIGYVLNSKYWGHGYATEVAKGLIKFGFEKLKLHRIAAICRPQNKASAKVMEKAGMKYEAHFKDHVFFKGKWYDSLQYAIVKK
jgi:RimJ/RimL family protein N-acetyltransferase